MDTVLQGRLHLFAENAQSMKKGFVWHDAMIKRLSALLYAFENSQPDLDLIRECHEQMKSETGVFSSFRGNLAICIATLLALSKNRIEQFSKTLTVYGMMKEAKFRASDYLATAAYQIAAGTSPDQFAHVIGRARVFYDGMKENHWFYTGRDDYIFAAMLGLSGMDVQMGVDRMQQLHAQLKYDYSYGNSIQALTQVLVLGGEAQDCIARLNNLRNALRDRNVRLDRQFTLSSLGVLTLLAADESAVADDVLASYKLLRDKKGFGRFSVTKQELLLLSAAIVASTYAQNMGNGVVTANLSTTITNIIIAQQAALAAAAAAAASSSSG